MHLVETGNRVFATVRRESDAESLRALGHETLVPILLDVADSASTRAGIEKGTSVLGDDGLHGIVHNAGVNVGGVLEALSLEKLREQFEVNVFGVVALTQPLLPLLRRTRGRIVSVSSAGAALPTPFGGAYAASKIALEALMHAWRRELAPFGIFTSVVRPGATDSAIWQKTGPNVTTWNLAPDLEELYRDKLASFQRAAEKLKARVIPPDEVVRAIEHALTARRPKATYIVGSEAWFSYFVDKLVPDSIVDYLVKKTLATPKSITSS